MAIGIANLQWLNHNAQRRYPLDGDCTAVDQSGSFAIPDDFIVYIDLPVNAGVSVSSGRFFIRNVSSYANGYSVVIGYQPDGGDPISVATAMIPRLGQDRNTVYALGGMGDFADSVGKIVIGRLDNIDQQPPGFWTFDFEATRLEPDAIRPSLRGVTSVVCVNGTQRSLPLQGTIELVAGANMVLTPILESGQDPVIRIDAVDGAGTIETCVCEGDNAKPEPIRMINGIPPTNDGNWSLVGSDCIQIVPIDNGIRLVNDCAKPCCGPLELERITQDLKRFSVERETVLAFVQQLSTAVTAMHTTVLGARLGDQTCVS